MSVDFGYWNEFNKPVLAVWIESRAYAIIRNDERCGPAFVIVAPGFTERPNYPKQAMRKQIDDRHATMHAP